MAADSSPLPRPPPMKALGYFSATLALAVGVASVGTAGGSTGAHLSHVVVDRALMPLLRHVHWGAGVGGATPLALTIHASVGVHGHTHVHSYNNKALVHIEKIVLVF